MQLRVFQQRPGAAHRLFCLPYGGGGAAVYRDWPAHLPPTVEMWSVDLPGRDSAFNEPLVRDSAPLVADIARALRPRLDRRYALFGHSLGALLAFEATRLLQQQGAPLPSVLVASAHPAPHLPPRSAPIHDLPDAAFQQRITELGGMPPGVTDDRELMDLYLPVLRADFAVAETHRWRPGTLLRVPIAAYGGADDKDVSHAELAAWTCHTQERCTVRLFPGRHFYIHTALADVLAALGADGALGPGSGLPALQPSRPGSPPCAD